MYIYTMYQPRYYPYFIYKGLWKSFRLKSIFEWGYVTWAFQVEDVSKVEKKIVIRMEKLEKSILMCLFHSGLISCENFVQYFYLIEASVLKRIQIHSQSSLSKLQKLNFWGKIILLCIVRFSQILEVEPHICCWKKQYRKVYSYHVQCSKPWKNQFLLK